MPAIRLSLNNHASRAESALESPRLASSEWPEKYLPGAAGNLCSNEVILKDLSSKGVWDALVQPKLWPGYYANPSDIEFRDKSRDETPFKDCKFSFRTIAFQTHA